MPKATCTLVGIISLPVEPGSPTSKTETMRTDDQRLADTLARLVGKTPATTERLRSMSRLSTLPPSPPIPQQTMMVRANVERLETQLYDQTRIALAEIELARV